MNASALSRLLLAVGLVLGACGDTDSGPVTEGGGGGRSDGGGLSDDDGLSDGGGGGGMDDGNDASVTRDAGGGNLGSDASTPTVPIVREAHRVIYWGDYGPGFTPAVSVLSMPSGDTLELDVSPQIDAYGVKVSRSGDRVLAVVSGVGSMASQLVAFDTSNGDSLVLDEAEYFDGFVQAISPDEAWVAYAKSNASVHGVYVVDIAGANEPAELQIGSGISVYDISWSPSGKLAAVFHDDATSGDTLWLFEKAGATWSATEVPRVQGTAGIGTLAWDTADGLYYVLTDTGDGDHIGAYDPSTGEAGVIAPVEDLIMAKGAVISIHDLEASFDGTRLAFRTDADVTDYLDVFVIDGNAGTFEQITHFATATPRGTTDDLSFGPGGTTVQFGVAWDVGSGQSGVTGSVLVTDLDGRVLSRIDAPQTPYTIEGNGYGQSPDRSTIYFTADVRSEGDRDLYGIDLEHVSADPWSKRLREVPSGSSVNGLVVTPASR